MTIPARWFLPGMMLAMAVLAALSHPISAQESAASNAPALTYADAADLALAAPIVAEVRVVKAEQIKSALAPGLAAGARRYLITADVVALIRGAAGLPARVSYLLDLSAGADGSWLKLRKQQFLIFARPVLGKPGTVQLIAGNAHQRAFPELSTRVRTILREANDAAAPPLIAGVGQAFHVAGTVEGEGETQIFLKAGDGRPLSLSIWRRPGTVPRWAVSLAEIVDEGAEPPARDTLLWYRLACALPQRLPANSTANLDPDSARIAAEDYAIVIMTLGPCQRSPRKQSPVQSS